MGSPWTVVRCLIVICLVSPDFSHAEEFEREPNDGWYNNLIHPEWGAIDTPLLRRSPTNYSDGSYLPSGEDRPNPLQISQVAFDGQDGQFSMRRRNALLVFFGQQMVEEIMDVQRPGCPREFFNIKVPKDHQYNPDGLDDLEMPFLRSRFDRRTGKNPNNPRQQINEITPYLDGNLMYGPGKTWEDAVREFRGGRLAAEGDGIKSSFPIKNNIRLPFANPPPPRDHVLRPVNRFRRYGNPRAHENPFLLSFGTIWFRYHNKVAGDIESENPDYSDEEIFNNARKRTIAQYQKIVMYEWLPIWLEVKEDFTLFDLTGRFPYEGGAENPYAGYDPNVHPGISTEFQAAALRFGHTLVPSGVRTFSGDCTESRRAVKKEFTTDSTPGNDDVMVNGVRLCNAYFVPEETVEVAPGIDNVVRGMVLTLAALEDNVIVSDIRENTFGPLDWSRRDLGALNIQRGRDHGLPGYNDVRAAYKLERRKSWLNVNSDGLYQEQLRKLSCLYNQTPTDAPDNLDLFPGGLLETTGDGPGELFKAIYLDQFLRIRHGDRFWFENRDNGLFDQDELDLIYNTTFADVLDSTTNVFEGVLSVPQNRSIFMCAQIGGTCGCNGFDVDDTSQTQEKCVPLQHYDYFQGSEGSFIATLVVIGLSIPFTIGIMFYCAKKRSKQMSESVAQPRTTMMVGDNEFFATEWVGRSSLGSLVSREVKVKLDSQQLRVLVSNYRGHVFRLIDLRSSGDKTAVVTRSDNKGNRMFLFAVPGEIDLVLLFPDEELRQDSLEKMKAFFVAQGWVVRDDRSMSENVLWREAFTFDDRKEELAKFFRSIVDALNCEARRSLHYNKVDDDVLNTKLTRTEFADALGLQPHSVFVRNMFVLMDVSGDGRLSFDEFRSYFGILTSGSTDQKAEMFFRMFDTQRDGQLTRDEYKKMIKTLIELQETEDTARVDVDNMVAKVFSKLGKTEGQNLTIEDFKKVMFSGDDDNIWKNAVLDLEVGGETLAVPKGPSRGKTVRNRATTLMRSYTKRPRPSSVSRISTVDLQTHAAKSDIVMSRMEKFTSYVGKYSRNIFWIALYTLIVFGIFIERAYYFSVEREHAGLRRMASWGVSITRGAASVQMFTYASLLVTMSRNTLTFFRETFLHRYIPFDNMHDMHIYIACLAMFFTMIHVIGHFFNLYHICTQASGDLNCYFQEYFRATDVLASFHYWTFNTITGLTGVYLTLSLMVLYVFASPYGRRHVFFLFTKTHKFYVMIYFLMFLHGGHRMVVQQLWPYFFLGPLVLYVLDKLVSVSRNKVLLSVSKASMLPSGVISLVFKRPYSFDYRSGQWVRIACPTLGASEYHPFTLTSAPHEKQLSLHIRAVGPWTSNLRHVFDPNAASQQDGFPKIYLDGPFGAGHQDWFRFKVSVLVGGGIGVTPFASILKDIAHRSKDIARFPCDKVYFLWVTRTQKSFEWMTDILRQVELADVGDFVDVYICITQLQNSFDLRTTMLYMCEQHFQKIAGLSMFTGLRAKTHFGRPKFRELFQSLKEAHSDVPQIGVFSCGPPAMTSSVQQGCTENNAFKGPSLIHHFENF